MITNSLIFNTDQWTSFHMTGTSVMKELKYTRSPSTVISLAFDFPADFLKY